MVPSAEGAEAQALIGRCLAGDTIAQAQFQEAYGRLIYEYPVRQYRLAPDAAGDFYVFALEGGRIYRRLRTFEGRTSLRAYLVGSVLDHLLLDWRRTHRELETVSIDSVGVLPDPGDDAGDGAPSVDPLAGVPLAKAVVMKLLYIQDYELTARELQHVAAQAKRPLRDVIAGVRTLRRRVLDREAEQQRVADALDAVHGWTMLYERRLFRIREDLAQLPPTAPTARALREEQALLEGKVRRRRAQRASLLTKLEGRRTHAPYRDVAALLNTSAANVATLVRRLRVELAAKLGVRLTQRGEGPRR